MDSARWRVGSRLRSSIVLSLAAGVVALAAFIATSEDARAQQPNPTPTATNSFISTPHPTQVPKITNTPRPTGTATPTSPPRQIKLPSLQNLFLTRQGNKIPPLRCVDSTNAATLTESMSAPVASPDPKNPSQTQQLGGFSFQVKYDQSKVCVTLRPGAAWTVNPQQVCTIQDSVTAPALQGIARINCVTLGKATVVDTSSAAGRVLAFIGVRPQPELYSQMKPNQDNGQAVQLNNELCKLTDLQGHAIPIFFCEDADVTIRFLEGDVEPDCAVNTLDTQAVAFRWGATKGSQVYNDRMNLEPSGTQADQDIDVNDLQFVYGRFASTCANPWPAQPPVNPKGGLAPAPTPKPQPIKFSAQRFPPKNNPSGASCGCGDAGNGPRNVDLDSGQVRLSETQLAIPSGRGIGFEQTMCYYGGWTVENGVFGAESRWEHLYESQLHIVTEANYDVWAAFPAGVLGKTPKPGDVVRNSGTCRMDLYKGNPSSTKFTSPRGFYDLLKRNNDGTFTLRDRDGLKMNYDATGTLTSIVDRNGNVVQLVYGANGKLSQVIEPLGRVINYSYDAQNRLSQVQDFIGRTTRYDYDSDGNLESWTGPPVTGTPNGNDFPNGKTQHFDYDNDGRITSITAPNEVAGGGPAHQTFDYEAAVGYSFGRVKSQTLGGTNASGVPAGGTYTIQYQELNPGGSDIDPNLARNQTTVTDRNGNITIYIHNGLGNEIEVRKLTNRNVRPSDPPAYVTRYEYNNDLERIETILPQKNHVIYDYDEGAPTRFQQGNLRSVTNVPDPARGGDQAQTTTTYDYEPIYNQLRSETEARGNDCPNYAPPNGGACTPGRYTTTYHYDYEEGSNLPGLATEINQTPAQTSALLSAAGIALSQGDVNGDGTTTQTAGNVIRTDSPTVKLLPTSPQIACQGDDSQEVVSLAQYNGVGQITKAIDPEGNVDVYEYHPENDPDGDGLDLTPSVGSGPLGYLKATVRDTASAAGRNCANPAPVSIRNEYFYDRVGNVTREVDGRGIETRYAVNALNQVVQVTGAAAHNVFATSPPEPIALTDFQYLERTFYDANDNVVRQQVEDRGNTSGVGGDNGGSGTAFVDSVYTYDILDQQVQQSEEVSDSEDLVTRYRYDPNGNQVLVIMPEGNASSAFYDERDLVFQSTAGATAPPALVQLAGGDPIAYDTRGGLASTVTSNYDFNGNLSETVDAADTDGSAANNSDIAGAGDRTRYLYDGFDRQTSVVDSVGNQSVTQYDPAGNVVRTASFGPVGGASPTSDGPDALPKPVSSAGVIVAANLLSANLLAASTSSYDELGRVFQSDSALFVNTIATARTPDVDDGATSLGKGNLTPGDTCAVPGVAAPPSGYLGCVTTRSDYDRDSRATFAVEDDGDTSRTFYDGAGRAIKSLDPEGNTVETAYDDNSNVIETRETDVSQVGGVASEVFLTTNFYDSLGRLQRAVDNVGETFDSRYDSRGNLVAQADAAGPAGPAISRRAFSGGALTVNTTNLFGNVTRYFYDGLGRQTRSESVLTASGEGDGTNIGADLLGVKTTTPAPDTSQGGGDGLIRTGTTWDKNSVQSALLDDQGNVTVYVYDNLDRMVTETKGLTVNTSPLDKTKILGSRNVVTPTVGTINAPATISAAKIDAQLAAAKTRINAVASLFPSLADSVDDNPPTTIAYGYDPDGLLLILEDENDSETFSKYDALNRRIAARVFRSGQADSHAGDLVFAPAPASDPSNPSTSFPPIVGTTKQDFQYDGLSRLVRATDNNEPSPGADDSLVTDAYDSLSRDIEEQQQIGALGAKAVDSAWRAENLRADVTYPQSGSFSRQLDYTYDDVDRLQTVKDTGAVQPIAGYDYLGGRVLVRSYPQNGTRLTYLNNAGTADAGYDGMQRTVQLRHLRADNSLVVGFTHSYDRMSNKLGETKLHNAANDEQYEYDAAYRLTDFDRPNGGSITPLHSNWTLDGAGNWTQVDAETRQHSSFNEITARAGTAILSDDNGNEFDDGTLTFTWDAGNRLRAATRKSDSALVATYSYDAAGRRIRKVVTNSGALNGTTDFYLDGAQEIEERDGTDAMTQQYVYGVYIDEPLVLDRNLGGGDSAIGSGDQRLFYHQNTLSSTFALTDSAAAIVEGYQYDAYGRQTAFAPGANTVVDFGGDDVVTQGGASALANPYLFTGRRLDPETQLYYYRARYLNTEQGRFVSRDPIAQSKPKVPLYLYVWGNPVNRLDPSGQGGKGSRCFANPPALPAGCRVVRRGTFGGPWLWCWVQYGERIFFTGSLAAAGLGSGCDLSNASIDGIANECNQLNSTEEQIQCVMRGIRTRLAGRLNRCNKNARCFKKVWERMGHEQSFKGRFILGSGGHAWNEVETEGGGKYYIDVGNDILLWCP